MLATSPPSTVRSFVRWFTTVTLRIQDTSPYHELNFSPSGEWAVYSFQSYRDGELSTHQALVPRISLQRRGGRLTLNARVQLDCLSPSYACEQLQVGLSAVIEGADGTLSYWALRHPPGKPDFHHAAGFALHGRILKPRPRQPGF